MAKTNDDDLLREADRMLDDAEDVAMDSLSAAFAIARKANRLRIQAAKAMPDGAEKLGILGEILFTADSIGDERQVVWAVRQAVRCNPSEERLAELRDYWECWGWTAKGDRKFPEPGGDEPQASRAPLPGQMSFPGM